MDNFIILSVYDRRLKELIKYNRENFKSKIIFFNYFEEV